MNRNTEYYIEGLAYSANRLLKMLRTGPLSLISSTAVAAGQHAEIFAALRAALSFGSLVFCQHIWSHEKDS